MVGAFLEVAQKVGSGELWGKGKQKGGKTFEFEGSLGWVAAAVKNSYALCCLSERSINIDYV